MIDILFLGTAAAEGWPGVFCQCDYCSRARKFSGKDIRTRSSIMIGDKYKIDFPPDTYMHVLKYGLDLGQLEHLLITHSHSDHFYPADIGMRLAPFAHLKQDRQLHIYGDTYVREGLEKEEALDREGKVVFHLMESFVPVQIGEMRVVPLKANHFPRRNCFNYLLEAQDKTIFYGLDTGWFLDETWDVLSRTRLRLAILDCTLGPNSGFEYHMGIDAVIGTKEKLVEMGTANEDTIFVATHFSHNGGLTHSQLEEAFSGAGILVAYDGMQLSI
ncbi:MAG: carbon-phosphorus lyase [Firmicutes bacterium]|nr:carbon-phosphorus lyase [Bacillota bacterium]